MSTKYEHMQRAKGRKERQPVDYPLELPKLRKIIVVIDFDFGKTVHILRLFRPGNIRQYRVEVDGRPWKDRIGLARILTGLRKAMPGVIAI